MHHLSNYYFIPPFRFPSSLLPSKQGSKNVEKVAYPSVEDKMMVDDKEIDDNMADDEALSDNFLESDSYDLKDPFM